MRHEAARTSSSVPGTPHFHADMMLPQGRPCRPPAPSSPPPPPRLPPLPPLAPALSRSTIQAGTADTMARLPLALTSAISCAREQHAAPRVGPCHVTHPDGCLRLTVGAPGGKLRPASVPLTAH